MMKKSKAEIDKSENKNKGMQEDEGYKTAIAKQIEKECSVVENQEQEEEDAGNDVGNSVEDNQIYENNGFNFEMDDEESRSSGSSISISSIDLKKEDRNDKRRSMLLQASNRFPFEEQNNIEIRSKEPHGSVRRLVQASVAGVGVLGKIGASSRNLLSGTTQNQRRLMKKSKDRDSFELALQESKDEGGVASCIRNRFNFEMDDEESRSSDSSISISSFDLNEEEREFKDMKKVVRFNSLISSSTLKNKE
eukprot:CAMPEP_0197841402 /NCGR_PEP_ID=MMETSP1437-20131217/46156_1 /TAXON_ID=49252 ORGANISM="Eucampia antarctica, Strain CCMP1452" /NCGR_SAMPLE_ID=MMETSP1437 /ASSEMBLY_ACC=CAM_ASM_001096 /LENGTH=249 /DNA_ID=CAMNT_0043451149 /DNA_START=246 /DNA_END=995 /DNA_ORIENTATION=-